MWSGAADAIPNGWALCDGSNDTPDLRGRFIVGAGGSYNVGNTGGAASVTLTVEQMPSHKHEIDSRESCSSFVGVPVGRGNVNGTNLPNGRTESTGGGQAHENRPPYYALCYIMKL